MFARRWKLFTALGVLVIAIGGCAMIGFTSTLEQPSYDVVERLPQDIEVRNYAPRTYAESTVDGTNTTARRQGFRLLFNYITGENTREEEISMTVPVETDIENGQHKMHFYLPSRYSEESAPAPGNENVTIGTIPARTEAAIRYTGSQSEQRAQQHMILLMQALENSDWKPVGEPRALFYNPPFSIPFLRRNEAIVEVERR